MGLDVRSTPEAMDELWMTELLAGSPVAAGGTVTSVAHLGDIGTGQTGRNARLGLTWEDDTGPGTADGHGRPATVVAKLPSADEHARATAFATGTYQRECHFYGEVAATLAVRTPTVHAARFDAATPDFVIVMEDIAEAVQGDQLSGLTPDQAELAAAAAADLHAPRWGDPALAELLAGGLTPELRAMGLTMLYGGTMAGFLERLGTRLDPDVVVLIEQLGAHIGTWVLGSPAPATVVHMDYRPDNFLFGCGPDAPPIVVVDWQTVTDGPAMVDLAYMIGGGFEPDVRAEVERDLLDGYRERLVDRGVDYSADDLWRDYRLGAIWGVVMTVIATMSAEETERGNDMLTAMANRHGRHALDLESLALL